MPLNYYVSWQKKQEKKGEEKIEEKEEHEYKLSHLDTTLFHT